jgi:hypothetical protein
VTLSLGAIAGPAAADDTFSPEEIASKATGFFGDMSEGLGKAIEKAFRDQGRPNAYIMGEEGSGAFIVGLRYGQGTIEEKKGIRRTVYWNGPSVGWDFGGNASKVFMLVYQLPDTQSIFQRFPGVEGSLYFVAGFGLNYVQSGSIVVAPIRTGVGLRAGAAVGYLSFTPDRSFVPF